MQKHLSWRVFPIKWLSQWQGWFLGKMLMNKQTPPLPANKELICSTLHQDRRSAAVLCERCRRSKERRQRFRLQSLFLISATAALALQPHCASEPGAWRDPWVLLTAPSDALRISKSSSSQEQHVSMCCFHDTVPVSQQGLGGHLDPCASLQPSLTECSGDSTPQHPCGVSSTRNQNFRVLLFTACHLPAVSFLEWVPSLQLSRSTGNPSCRCSPWQSGPKTADEFSNNFFSWCGSCSICNKYRLNWQLAFYYYFITGFPEMFLLVF